MSTRTTFELSRDARAERQALRETILHLMAENSLSSLRTAQEQLSGWLERYPDDYMMREAGEVLARSEEALLAVQNEKAP